MQRSVVLCVCIILVGSAFCAANSDSSELSYSDISADEVVVFFRTTAWLNESSQEWQVPIHGWIYEPEDSAGRKALFAAILKNEFDLAPGAGTEDNFGRRLNLLIADNERNKRIVIAIAGGEYTLPPSGPNGHFETTLRIPVADADQFMENSLIRYSTVSKESESRTFAGEVMFVDPTGLSVISDIDDTVKISDVAERRSLLEHTFLLDFAAVPDVAPLYRTWSKQGVNFHFVSSSPWQLYPPLKEFLDDAGFPWSALELKPVRFRDETLFDLFKKGTETKPAVIEKILNMYPQRQFILVGDSGEHDPEVYAALLRKYPLQILKIYIRNVTQESADNERFASTFKNIDKDCWRLFDSPGTLELPEEFYN